MSANATELIVGWQRFQAGDLAQAEQICRQALQFDSTHADPMFLLGAILEARGELDHALSTFEMAIRARREHSDIASRPEFAAFHNNLGVTFAKLAKPVQAATCFERAIEIHPGFAEAHNNLGNVRRDLGRPELAAASYQQALSCRPYYVPAHFNVGMMFMEQGRHEEAVESFRSALRFKPDYVDAQLNLTAALIELGKSAEAKARRYFAEAAASCQEVLRHQPDNERVRFFHALLSGERTPDTPPAHSVRELFDKYADDFDEKLVGSLNYRAPQLLRAAVGELPDNRSLAVLDLGCGTGLCGPLFREAARTLTGVDLSPGMLEKARQRGVYDELLQNDIVEALSSQATQFDLIVAADVFVYIGSLANVFAGVRRSLRPSGSFAFTVEAHNGDGFAARTSARFAHSLPYVRGLTQQYGLAERSVQRAVLRKESDGEIEGFVVVLQLPN